MADEALSQAELETLLGTIDFGPPSTGGGESVGDTIVPPPHIPVSGPPVTSPERVATYDFKRPQRVEKEHLRALQALHERFARSFSQALSTQLRSSVQLKLVSVEQLVYEEFVATLDSPTCFNQLRAAPPETNLALDLSPSILYPIIDRLLGGGRDTSPVSRRPLTEIELRLVARITGLILLELRKAWQGVHPLDLSVERVESSPQSAPIVAAHETVIVISFELALNQSRGAVKLCFPWQWLEPIGDKLVGSPLVSRDRRPASGETIRRISENLQQSVVELVAQLAETKITSGDLFNLRVGDIIATEKDVHSPMSVCVEGVAKFRAEPGAFKGRKAVQIDERLISPADGQAPQ
jgi:flagellar motor switch protein FliM